VKANEVDLFWSLCSPCECSMKSAQRTNKGKGRTGGRPRSPQFAHLPRKLSTSARTTKKLTFCNLFVKHLYLIPDAAAGAAARNSQRHPHEKFCCRCRSCQFNPVTQPHILTGRQTKRPLHLRVSAASKTIKWVQKSYDSSYDPTDQLRRRRRRRRSIVPGESEN
jgi:hypothetical protein